MAHIAGFQVGSAQTKATGPPGIEERPGKKRKKAFAQHYKGGRPQGPKKQKEGVPSQEKKPSGKGQVHNENLEKPAQGKETKGEAMGAKERRGRKQEKNHDSHSGCRLSKLKDGEEMSNKTREYQTSLKKRWKEMRKEIGVCGRRQKVWGESPGRKGKGRKKHRRAGKRGRMNYEVNNGAQGKSVVLPHKGKI